MAVYPGKSVLSIQVSRYFVYASLGSLKAIKLISAHVH